MNGDQALSEGKCLSYDADVFHKKTLQRGERDTHMNKMTKSYGSAFFGDEFSFGRFVYWQNEFLQSISFISSYEHLCCSAASVKKKEVGSGSGNSACVCVFLHFLFWVFWCWCSGGGERWMSYTSCLGFWVSNFIFFDGFSLFSWLPFHHFFLMILDHFGTGNMTGMFLFLAPV